MVKKHMFFETVKNIRDPVHGYITLSKLEIAIIDTPLFQRLKDIRQLTSQQVYPAARHTRFEHSIGVLELTKRAIIKLVENGVLEKKLVIIELDFSVQEVISIQLAALLHDIGHCPFSHMGEAEVCKKEAGERFIQAINNAQIEYSTDKNTFINKITIFKGAATHEILSCIIILEKLRTIIEKNVPSEITIDYELIIRSIIGMKYEITPKDYQGSEKKSIVFEKKRKNLLIDLINSSVLDMDKIDYIMRDAFYTGIEVPKIDVRQLFMNMYVSPQYDLRFTSRAVPILQNLIASRDDLYLWVYNHHTSVFSDFLYSYIIRRFAHNAEEEALENKRKEKYDLGEMPRSYLFSVDSIVDEGVTDSDWISFLNNQLRAFTKDRNLSICGDNEKSRLRKKRALEFIEALISRTYLKPWWKRPFEFRLYLNENFVNNESKQKELTDRISNSNSNFDATEFRSQFAKHIFYLVNHYKELSQPILEDGDLFIVPRANKFFGQEDVEQLNVCLKSNEVSSINYSATMGVNTDSNNLNENAQFYTQSLAKLMPQKNPESIFGKSGFFLYVRRYDVETSKKNISKTDYYNLINKAFVFVAKELTDMAREEFMAKFDKAKISKEDRISNENRLNDELLRKFIATLKI